MLVAGAAVGVWAYSKHKQRSNVHIMALNLVRGVPLTPKEKQTMLDLLSPPPSQRTPSSWWRSWRRQWGNYSLLLARTTVQRVSEYVEDLQIRLQIWKHYYFCTVLYSTMVLWLLLLEKCYLHCEYELAPYNSVHICFSYGQFGCYLVRFIGFSEGNTPMNRSLDCHTILGCHTIPGPYVHLKF